MRHTDLRLLIKTVICTKWKQHSCFQMVPRRCPLAKTVLKRLGFMQWLFFCLCLVLSAGEQVGMSVTRYIVQWYDLDAILSQPTRKVIDEVVKLLISSVTSCHILHFEYQRIHELLENTLLPKPQASVAGGEASGTGRGTQQPPGFTGTRHHGDSRAALMAILKRHLAIAGPAQAAPLGKWTLIDYVICGLGGWLLSGNTRKFVSEFCYVWTILPKHRVSEYYRDL